MTPPPATCRRCLSAIEAGDLRCPVCYLAVPAGGAADQGQARVQLLRCRTCGAAMEYVAKARAPQCVFCGGVVQLEERLDPTEQTERYLPFTVDRETAIQAYRQWLSRQGFFRPANLASAARLESLQALWWVGWAVDAQALVSWTADSDANAHKADWAPHAGELSATFEQLVIPATRGLSAEECSRLIPSYRFGDGDSAVPESGADIIRERFDIPRSYARARIIAAIQGLAEARVRNEQLPGSRFRNFQSTIHLRGLVTRRLSFPAYVMAYRYRSRLYRTVISGQDGSCLVGQLPVSVARVLLVVALGALALAGVLALLLQFAR